MTVTIDVAGTEVLGAITSSSPQTYTGLTTGGSLSNGAVTFVVMYDNLAVTGTDATWDGIACTLIAAQNSTGGTFGRVELWGLSPIGTHTGNKTFSISFTGGTAQLVIQGQSWTGANSGGTPFNHSVAATGNTALITGNVTSQTNDAVFAGYVCSSQTMSGQTGTLLFNDNAPNSYIASASRTGGAASVTMSATLPGSGIWAMAGANITQPTAGVAISQTGAPVHNIAAATQNFTFTTVSGDTLAVFYIFQDSSTSNAISSVTWDSGGTNQACTLIASRGMTTTGNGAINAYGVVNPTVGTKTLAVVQALSQQMAADMQSYTGTITTSVGAACLNPQTALGSSGAAQASTQTGNVGDLLVSAYGTINTFSGLSNTRIYTLTANARESAANTAAATGSAIGLTATLTATAQWAALSFAITAPAASGPFVNIDTGTYGQLRTRLLQESAYNQSLYITKVQPRAPHITKLPGRVFPPVPDQFYNQALYSVTVSALPFNSVDFGHSNILPDWAPAPPPPLNINLFTNPIPFTQTDWSKPFHLPLALPQPSSALNINLFTNPYPFNQYDWAKPVRLPRAPVDLSFQFNQNLTNFFPFNQTDWSKPFSVQHAPFDLSVSLNPNIFTNPYPFLNIDVSRSGRLAGLPQVDVPYNQPLYTVTVVAAPFNQTDWSKPFGVPHAPFDLSVPLNPNIFTNPIPILNLDNVGKFLRKTSLLSDQAYNQALYNVTVTAPFYAAEILFMKRPVAAPLPDQPLNINLFTNPYPFNQYDFLKLLRVPQAPFSPDQALNINLFTNPFPFLNIDASRSARLKGLPQVDSSYNQSLYTVTVTAAPFNQTYWPPSLGVPIAPVDFYNLVLYNIVTLPFNQTDWSKPFTLRRAPFDLSVPLNPNIFTNPYPFNQYDVSVAVKLKGLPDTSQPYNVNLYGVVTVQVPFNQVDWSKPFVARSVPTQDQALNINLFTNPYPFAQYDWRKPFGVRQALFDLSVQTNINIFTNPIPFSQFDYPRQQSVKLGPSPVQPYNQNLYTATVAGTTLHVVKFIGNVGHFMIR